MGFPNNSEDTRLSRFKEFTQLAKRWPPTKKSLAEVPLQRIVSLPNQLTDVMRLVGFTREDTKKGRHYMACSRALAKMRKAPPAQLTSNLSTILPSAHSLVNSNIIPSPVVHVQPFQQVSLPPCPPAHVITALSLSNLSGHAVGQHTILQEAGMLSPLSNSTFGQQDDISVISAASSSSNSLHTQQSNNQSLLPRSESSKS